MSTFSFFVIVAYYLYESNMTALLIFTEEEK